MTNWRDLDRVHVGWAGRPEMGTIHCDVEDRDTSRDEPHGVRTATWASGSPMAVAYSHAEHRYVFCDRTKAEWIRLGYSYLNHRWAR
jgi:hypothetical protein